MKESIKRIIVIIFIVLIAIFTFISTRGSFLEYKELGEKYVSIFKTNLSYDPYLMKVCKNAIINNRDQLPNYLEILYYNQIHHLFLDFPYLHLLLKHKYLILLLYFLIVII